MNSILSRVRAFLSNILSGIVRAWRKFRTLRPRTQIFAAVVAVVVIGAGIFFSQSGNKAADAEGNLRAVTVESVASLSGTGTGTGVLGTVRSLTSADLLAQSGGSVTAVRTTVGASVPAGFVIAELENSVQSAQVLSAQGAYEAALAASQTVAPEQVKSNAFTAYQSAYASADGILKTYVDTVFGTPQTYGPVLLIDSHTTDPVTFSQRRQALKNRMDAWSASVSTADSKDPAVLLAEADALVRAISSFVNDLNFIANDRASNATAAQLTALATARTTANSLLSTVSAASAAYKSQSQANTGGNASVKQALGALRLAQAGYEKTIVRAPIAGTVNFLPVRVGDYVNALQHVATVAQNGALEIAAQISEENAATLTAGGKVRIDGKYDGTVTSIAPALDPITKQIEVRMAVTGTTALVNGQSVRIELPAKRVTVAAEHTGPVLLPLTTVKLTSDARVVFTVNADGRLVAVPVTIGDVRGERIEITSALAGDVMIVTDARGLSEGERVRVVATTPN